MITISNGNRLTVSTCSRSPHLSLTPWGAHGDIDPSTNYVKHFSRDIWFVFIYAVLADNPYFYVYGVFSDEISASTLASSGSFFSAQDGRYRGFGLWFNMYARGICLGKYTEGQFYDLLTI